MKTKKILKKLLLTVVVLIVTFIVVGLGFWLIDGRSPQAFIVSHALKKTTMEDYQRMKGDQTDKSTVEIPDDVSFPRNVTQYQVGHMQVFESTAQDNSKPILLYIHGGAYYMNFSPLHWKAMAEWAEKTGCGIVAPNYPLLYQYTAKDAHPLMLQLYHHLLERFPARRIIIGGDSAGADWAAEFDTHDPMVSPLYGDMQGLPATDLFTGTWEVFYTDIQKIYDKMKAAGVDVRLHEKKKMGHVYPLWPCPEGKEAREEIADIIRNS